MKRSIKRQMIVLFTGLIVCVFVVLFVVIAEAVGQLLFRQRRQRFRVVDRFHELEAIS